MKKGVEPFPIPLLMLFTCLFASKRLWSFILTSDDVTNSKHSIPRDCEHCFHSILYFENHVPKDSDSVVLLDIPKNTYRYTTIYTIIKEKSSFYGGISLSYSVETYY